MARAALVLLLLVLGLVLWLTAAGDGVSGSEGVPSPERVGEVPTGVSAPDPPSALRSVEPLAGGERLEVGVEARPSKAEARPEASIGLELVEVELVEVEVVDARGVPVAGVGLLRDGRLAATSDERGVAQLPATDEEALTTLRRHRPSEGYVELGSGRRIDAERRAVMVVAPARRVVGRVSGVAPDGTPEGPLAGAKVRRGPRRDLTGLPVLSDYRRPWDDTVAESGPDGRFALEAVPDLDGELLSVSAEGYSATEVELLTATGEVSIELQRRRVAETPDLVTIEVRVLARDGRPVPDAWLSLLDVPDAGFDVTDAGGFGRLTVEPSALHGRPRALPGTDRSKRSPAFVVRHAEHGLERFEAELEQVRRASAESDSISVDLVYSGAPLIIGGRLVAADGEPLVGWSVRCHEGTTRDTSGLSMLSWVEGDLTVVADGDGGFVLGPLLDQSYTLVALGPDEQVAVRGPELPAGTTGYLWQLDRRDLLERLAGRVVDESGQPVADAVVSVSAEYQRTTNVWGGAMWRTATRASAPTDAEGRFELARVPGRVGVVDVSADLFPPLEPLSLDLADLIDPEHVTLVVRRQKALRLELEGDLMGDEGSMLVLDVVDREGQSLPLRWGNGTSIPLLLVNATEPVYTVSPEAVEARIVRRPSSSGAPGAEAQQPEVVQSWPLAETVNHLRFVVAR